MQTVFLLSITLCAMIPKSAIEENAKKSADFYCDKYMFQQMIKNENSTVVHNYADLVWLNIAWSEDEKTPFFSALNAAYYDGEDMYKSESFYKAVYEKEEPNKSYSRYWHGALIFIKPLLTVTDAVGIKKINIGFCVLLVLFLAAMLGKRKQYVLLAGYTASLFLSFSYIIPLCMEYMPAFVIMHIASMLVLKYSNKMKRRTLCAFFASVGAIECFFDFLTNEIITLFVPLIFLLCERNKSDDDKINSPFKESVLCGAMWLFGYLFTWLVKWLLCFAVLGKSNFTDAVSDGAYRMAGAVPGMEQNQIFAALIKNIHRLFPFNFLKSETAVSIAALSAVFVLFCIFFLYRKEKVPKTVRVFLLIACTPYMRYMLLSNHSCLHPVFTFRTQIITVIALFAAFGQGIDFDAVLKKGRSNADKRRRKKTKRINNFNAVPK